jgi:hypothetical protein
MLAAALAARGVKFEICEITLRNRKLKKEPFIQEAGVTPAGLVRIAKLQSTRQCRHSALKRSRSRPSCRPFDASTTAICACTNEEACGSALAPAAHAPESPCP